ncbi:MAG: hypothetical protein ACHQVS_00455 [Candidatus Babeliales bacterium]
MQLTFQQVTNRVTWLSLCVGWVVPAQSTPYHFSANALAALSQVASKTACSNTQMLHADDHLLLQKSEKNMSWLTVDRVHTLINSAACLYALIRIAQCYHRYFIAHAPQPERWYDQFITIGDITIVKKIRFTCAAVSILGETLVGKTLVKLLLVCATGDITDLIEQALVRMKKMVVG